MTAGTAWRFSGTRCHFLSELTQPVMLSSIEFTTLLDPHALYLSQAACALRQQHCKRTLLLVYVSVIYDLTQAGAC